MIINVRIELTQAQLLRLADVVDGKQTQRPASRAEVREIAAEFVESLCAPPIGGAVRSDDLSIPDPEDREVLAGMPPDYIRGWNRFKRKLGSTGK